MNIINDCCRGDDKNAGIVLAVIMHMVTPIFRVLITNPFWKKQLESMHISFIHSQKNDMISKKFPFYIVK